MLEMSWITAILHFNSQVTDRFGNVFVKLINIILFDLLARFHYILNPPRIISHMEKKFSFTFAIKNWVETYWVET